MALKLWPAWVVPVKLIKVLTTGSYQESIIPQCVTMYVTYVCGQFRYHGYKPSYFLVVCYSIVSSYLHIKRSGLFVGLIVFTPTRTLLNIYVLLIPIILEHWTDLSAAGWLLLLIFGMGSQLIWFYRERLVGGALYWKMCSVVYALDLYSCMYMYEVITVKKVLWWGV